MQTISKVVNLCLYNNVSFTFKHFHDKQHIYWHKKSLQKYQTSKFPDNQNHHHLLLLLLLYFEIFNLLKRQVVKQEVRWAKITLPLALDKHSDTMKVGALSLTQIFATFV